MPDVALLQNWKNARTRSDIASIHRALEGFKTHYGRLPYNSPKRSYQCSVTLGHDLNGMLTNTDRLNPEEVVFWNIPTGEQRDGWGQLYHYYFDHDADGLIDTGTQIVSGDYFVWSDGPDQTNDGGTNDDVH